MRHALSTETEETRYGVVLDWVLLKRFMVYLKSYRLMVVLALLLVPLTTATQLGQPLIIKTALDDYLIPAQLEGFHWLVIGFATLLISHFIFSYLQSRLNAWLGQQVVRDLRTQLFDHTIHLDEAFYTSHASGRLTNRMTNDVEAVNQMVSAGLVSVVSDLILMIAVITAMFLLSPWLSVLTLTAFPVIIWVTFYVRHKLRDHLRNQRVLQSRMAAHLTEGIEGQQVVKLFHRQSANHADFTQLNDEFQQAAKKSNFWEAFQFSFVEASSTVMIALLLWYGNSLNSEAAVSLGTLVAFIELIRKLFLPLRGFSAKFTLMQASMTALERIFHLLDTQTSVNNPTESKEPPSFNQGIALNKVCFGYQGEHILEDIQLFIPKGSRWAIVGPTGVGKSSLVKLLNRSYDSSKGEIFIDQREIRSIPLRQLRRLVGIASQDPFLFAGTLSDNITLFNPEISPQTALNAAQQVGLDRFFNPLKEGMKTAISERGNNLSSGQRQLIALARIMAWNPPILILDEATSSLDSLSEQMVQAALQKILTNRTALIVAHRLSTVRHADQILVLAHGQIEEMGTHEELLNKNGRYARLAKMQLGNPS